MHPAARRQPAPPLAALLAALAAALAAALPGARPLGAAPARPLPRAAWVYDAADLPPADLAAALDTLGRRGVTRLYLSIEDGPAFRLDDAEGRAGVARAAAAATARGMDVHAMLLQHPHWLEDLPGALARVAAAAAFGDRPGEHPFGGLHLDVEPHTLDAWECGGPDGRARLTGRLADLAAAARRTARAVRPLTLSVAVPWWTLGESTPAGEAAARALAGRALALDPSDPDARALAAGARGARP